MTKQWVEIMTARWPGVALSISAGAEIEMNMEGGVAPRTAQAAMFPLCLLT